MADDVNYQPVAVDTEKSCVNCKNFSPKEGQEMGECFGHEVSSKATCDYFSPKEG